MSKGADMKRFAILLACMMLTLAALVVAPATALAATDIANCTLDISWSSEEYNGANQVPTLTVKDGSTILQEGVDYTVTLYRDDDWNETPLTEAVDAGVYFFEITGMGSYEGNTYKVFTITQRPIGIYVNDTSVAWTGSMLYGSTEYFTDGAIDEWVPGHAATITYTPASGIDPGTYDNGSFADDFMVIDSAGRDVTANYQLVSTQPGKLTVEAVQSHDISDCTVHIGWTEATYDGTSQVPNVTVTYGGSTLTPGVDYDVTILDEGNSPITEAIHAGNYKLHISGKGDYRGDLDKEFTIQQRSVNDGSVTVEPIALAVYTGAQLEPAVTVKFQGVALTQDVDYTLGYRDNVETGTGYVIISGTGDFSGMREESFGIVSEGDLSQGSIGDIPDEVFTGSPIEPALKVYLPFSTEPLRLGVDYEAVFSGNEDVGTARIKVTGKGALYGSLTGTFNIVEADISQATVSVADQVYDGTPLTPLPEVTWNGIPLVLDKDFEVAGYTSNIGPGQASVQVTGKGNFTGTADGNFTIQAPMYSLEVMFGGLSPEYRFGELVDGQIHVTNTGAALGEFTVTCGLTGQTWTIPGLDAGGEMGGFFDYLVTYADVEAGGISTAVSVTAKGPNGEDVAVTITDATATVVPTPAAITLDLGEGELDGQTGTIIIDANVGQTIQLPSGTPTLAGHTFQYWQGSEYYPGDDYTVDGDHTLKAVFTKNQPTIPDTGDATPLALAVAVALLAASAFGMVLARRRG